MFAHRSTCRRPRGAVSGFTLVEVVVVLVIIAILFGFAFHMWASARKASTISTGVSTMRVYEQAIDQFAGDHQGRIPRAVGSADWPAPVIGGPFSPLARSATASTPAELRGRYVRSIPDSVANGMIGIGSGGERGTITYIRRNDTDYELRFTLKGASRAECSVGVNLPSSTRECGEKF